MNSLDWECILQYNNDQSFPIFRRTHKRDSKETEKTNNILHNQSETIYNEAFEPHGNETTNEGATNQNFTPSECEKSKLFTNHNEIVYGNQESK